MWLNPVQPMGSTSEDIIAEHGERVPDHTESQRDFRAAVILLIDENHPATTGQLDLLTHYIDTFTFPEMDRLNSVNFYEATGGRATISMGELSTFLKRGGPRRGTPPPDAHPRRRSGRREKSPRCSSL